MALLIRTFPPWHFIVAAFTAGVSTLVASVVTKMALRNRVTTRRQFTGTVMTGRAFTSSLVVSEPRELIGRDSDPAFPDTKGLYQICIRDLYQYVGQYIPSSVLTSTRMSAANTAISDVTAYSPGTANGVLANTTEAYFSGARAVFNCTSSSATQMKVKVTVYRAKKIFTGGGDIATNGEIDPITCASTLASLDQPAMTNTDTMLVSENPFAPGAQWERYKYFTRFFEKYSVARCVLEHGQSKEMHVNLPPIMFCPALDARGRVQGLYGGQPYFAVPGKMHWVVIEIEGYGAANLQYGSTPLNDMVGVATGCLRFSMSWHETCTSIAKQNTWRLSTWTVPNSEFTSERQTGTSHRGNPLPYTDGVPL